jgi:putative oxidoreductase
LDQSPQKIAMKKFFLASTQFPRRDWILAIVRIWFGINMMKNGKFIFDDSQLPFFRHWFGAELHFPAPILMYYLAKGSEFFGGAFLCVGLFSRVASSLIAFTMLVATFTANKGNMFEMDGTITFAFMSISLWFLFYGPGRWSLDYLLFDRRLQPKPLS